MSKRALCIGINDYPGTQADLAGCVNDAHDWSAVLKQRGFEVTPLLNGSATRRAMSDAIEKLIEAGRTGDTLVITYSGHGTWVAERGHGDEADGRDEGLCPYDIGKQGPLLDDEIHGLFAARREGVGLVLISDSCHSGSVTRAPVGNVDPDTPRPRFLAPEAWMKRESLPKSRSAATLAVRTGIKGAGGDLLLAGCRDDQVSWDTRFEGRANGAFTYYAIRSLKGLDSGGTYEQWFKRIRDFLPSIRLKQDPQIFGPEAARDLKVL